MRVVRSRRSSVFLLKLAVPALSLAAVVALCDDDPLGWRLVFTLPLIVLGLFHASLGEVELFGGNLRYRRFFRWHAIRLSDVGSSGVLWRDFIGYAKLSHFVLPFGRLYFVLDENSSSQPFQRGDYPLLRYIAERAGPGRETSPETRGAEPQSRPLKLVGAAALGAALSLVRIYISDPGSQSAPTLPANQTQVVIAFINLLRALDHTWPAAAVALVLAVAASRIREYQRARVLAFISGVFVPLIFW